MSAPLTAGGVPSGELPSVVEKVLPSVVSVYSSKAVRARSPMEWWLGGSHEERQRGLGSGVVFDADGLIVTNNHVVEDADEVLVRLADGREISAKVLGTDPKSDLAVLRVDTGGTPLVPVALGNSDALRLGEVVLAVGNPFGVGQTVTMGIVSAKGRADMGIVDYEDFIQTDAAINPGNSGGALVNARGELVGINTAILSRSGGNVGIGFAFPTNMARPIVLALRDKGKVSRGFMGANLQELTPELREALGLGTRKGVLIADLQPDGPAEHAGVKSGDVVLGVGTSTVESSGQLRNLIAGAGAGATVELQLLRQGRPLSVKVELAQLPGEEMDSKGSSRRGSEEAGQEVDGLGLRALGDELRARLEVPEDVKGTVVAVVAPGSRAARAGLQRGDIIVEIDRKPVTVPGEVHKALQSSGKTPHLLGIWRRGSRLFLAFR